MRRSWWLVVLGMLMGCGPSTLYEACEDLSASYCECGDDPYAEGESAEDACYSDERTEQVCSTYDEQYGDNEAFIEAEACRAKKYRRSCDWEAAVDACPNPFGSR